MNTKDPGTRSQLGLPKKTADILERLQNTKKVYWNFQKNISMEK